MQKQNSKSKNILIFIFVFGLLSLFSLFPQITSAQVQSTDIVLNITPEYPKPNDKVTARLSSYVVNLNKANIAWYLNDQNVSVGIGKNTFSFTLDASNTATTLSVSIEIIGGQNITKSIVINGSDVDMLWEAVDSYVPPFYKGKALVSKEGTFKVVAVPSIVQGGVRVNPNNLSYTWKKDGKGQSIFSGWGKSFYSFTNSYLERTNEIRVKVSDISGNVNTENTLTLRPVNPKIVFYKKDKSLGIMMQKSLEDYTQIGEDGATLVAIPYFFSPKDLSRGDLDFKWTIGNNQVSTPSLKNELSVRGVEGESGNTTVSLSVENTKTLFQNVDKKLNVSF